mgnify:CR=1 FL=1
MLELATSEPATVSQDTPAPAQQEARISETDMDKLADKVSEAASPKTEAERAPLAAAIKAAFLPVTHTLRITPEP